MKGRPMYLAGFTTKPAPPIDSERPGQVIAAGHADRQQEGAWVAWHTHDDKTSLILTPNAAMLRRSSLQDMLINSMEARGVRADIDVWRHVIEHLAWNGESLEDKLSVSSVKPLCL